jgi:hypothetical protein
VTRAIDLREYYALNVLALDGGLLRPGAPALFDMAISNGLVAIVSYEWSGSHLTPGRPDKLKAAEDLLKLITARAEKVVKGVYRLQSGTVRATEVRVGELGVAVRRLNKVRHGAGGLAMVMPGELEALKLLDAHPALGSLRSYGADESEAQDLANDADERARAGSYLEMLADDEIARRVESAKDSRSRSPDNIGLVPPLQQCGVCAQVALVVKGVDNRGAGIGFGTCFVCGYSRSRSAADLEAEYEIYLRFSP